jgi:hypothetical protein
MHPVRALCIAALGTAIATTVGLVAHGSSAEKADARVAAQWKLNDRAPSTRMADSSGNHLVGRVSSRAAAQGLRRDGARYRWSARCPGCLPVERGRVIRVMDSRRLEIPRASVTYTLAVRFRTSRIHPGNLIQKGHSTAPGGQIKLQATNGILQCLFKGANGVRVGTGSPTPLNDGRWHVVRCIHKVDRVVEYVDGVRVAVNKGSTGPINNDKPLTIGGKLRCDQVDVTCDYFSGAMGWIRISHG